MLLARSARLYLEYWQQIHIERLLGASDQIRSEEEQLGISISDIAVAVADDSK